MASRNWATHLLNSWCGACVRSGSRPSDIFFTNGPMKVTHLKTHLVEASWTETVLFDTNCRSTVPSNTVFVSSPSIPHRSDTNSVQSITTQYRYSTGEYPVCIGTVLDPVWIQYWPVSIQYPIFTIRLYTFAHTYTQSLLNGNDMYHKLSMSKLCDVNFLS